MKFPSAAPFARKGGLYGQMLCARELAIPEACGVPKYPALTLELTKFSAK
jgi:hypothetical protein